MVWKTGGCGGRSATVCSEAQLWQMAVVLREAQENTPDQRDNDPRCKHIELRNRNGVFA